MKLFLLRILSLFILVFLSETLDAQQNRYYQDIQKFKKQDSIAMPLSNAILFIGSSSFTRWTDVQSYFPGYTIINRAFGGSTLPDVIDYAKDNISLYKPKQVVIYCGENDFASSDSVTPLMVLNRFKELFNIIRSKAGAINITYISIKPSPVRKNNQLKSEQANVMIRKFLESKPKTGFVDVYHLMLKKDRDINSAIFTSDSLHISSKGYVIWQKAILPYLVK